MRKLLPNKHDLQIETRETLLENLRESNNKEEPGNYSSGSISDPRATSDGSESDSEESVAVGGGTEVEEPTGQIVVAPGGGKAAQGKLRRSIRVKKRSAELKDCTLLLF